ncbi:MAG: alpha/beta fold hydrolase [Dokdonella sp.]
MRAANDAGSASSAAPKLPPKAADFQPPRLLRNPHLQSVLASSGIRRQRYARQRATLERNAVEHILDCGNGVRLQGFHSRQNARPLAHGLVVLLHGWEGSAQSTYLAQTASRLLRDGFDVFRLNFRDHGATHHLNREIFHSCRIDEVVGAVREIGNRFPDRQLSIAGFSLGGNFALRVALRAPTAGIPLTYAVAVCPVISPRSGLFGIEQSPWFYEQYFLHKWRGSLRRKQRSFPDEELFAASDLSGNLRELTRSLVQRHSDFDTLENYLDGYSIAADALANLRIPAAILASADDPVIPVHDFHTLQLPAQVELDITAHGGHCGFIANYALHSWAEDYIAERLLRASESAA